MLWAILTITAAAAQTARNALQRGLTGEVGALGATHARFLYGLPFALAFLGLLALTGAELPRPNGASLGWVVMGGLAQIGATACLLAAMRSSGFLVAVAYTKTEPVLVLIAVAILIGDVPGPGQIVAILVATGGVLLMSWPGEAARKGAWWRPLGLGLSAAALFALSAVGFGAAILALDHPGFIAAALTTLAIALTFQTAVLSAWLAWRKPGILRALLADPRKALPAGCTGAVASAFWFMAFALASPALVRTLALVEVFFSHIVGQRVLDERITRREAFGAALTTAGITGLFLSG